jgi:hypothetical protein
MDLEPCEERCLMTISWVFTYDGPAKFPMMTSPQMPTAHTISEATFEKNLQDAGKIINNALPDGKTISLPAWNETITVEVTFVPGGGNGSNRAGGAPAEKTEPLVGQFNRGGQTFYVYEPQDILQARSNGTTAGIHLWFDPTYLQKYVSIDESPGLTGKAPEGPNGKADFISLAIHEMIHGMGFSGYRTIASSGFGTFSSNQISTFDSLTEPLKSVPTNGNPLMFYGKRADDMYGGPVPLTSLKPGDPEAFYHLGNLGKTDGLSTDPLTGGYFPNGVRFNAASLKLDAAMLNDMFNILNDRKNLVIVLDSTSANNKGDLAFDIQTDTQIADNLLKQDPLSQVDVIDWQSATTPPKESGFTTDLASVNSTLAGIKLSGQKGPIPGKAYSQLYALIKTGRTSSTVALPLPKSPTELMFDDGPLVTVV